MVFTINIAKLMPKSIFPCINFTLLSLGLMLSNWCFFSLRIYLTIHSLWPWCSWLSWWRFRRWSWFWLLPSWLLRDMMSNPSWWNIALVHDWFWLVSCWIFKTYSKVYNHYIKPNNKHIYSRDNLVRLSLQWDGSWVVQLVWNKD